MRERARQFLRAGVIDIPPPNAMRQKWRNLTLRGSANVFVCHFVHRRSQRGTFGGEQSASEGTQAIGVIRSWADDDRLSVLARHARNHLGLNGFVDSAKVGTQQASTE